MVEINGTEYLYKLLVVGDLGCGKTSIIHRYVSNTYSTKYRATIGVDFALKVLQWDDNTSVRLQLWDIAGQERFGHMTRVYYKEAVGAMVVFDVTRSGTFEAVRKWKEDLDSNLSSPEHQLPCILLANKCDLAQEPLDKDKMDAYVKENGFIGWFETSAKEDIGIKKAYNKMVEHILTNDPEINEKDPDAFQIGSKNQKTNSNNRNNNNNNKDKCDC
mmetsp:Transcript_11637/g.19429  ORF Transcript_11637/g.19429 Transcript_11637/m.19429 type:complete len:217 (+) Transcript_11637:55-705(+)